MKSDIGEIETILANLARKGRLGDYANASLDLNRCLLLIEQEKAGLRCVPKPLLEKFNYSLETIFLMLSNKDWVAIADIVEYEMLALWSEMAPHFGRRGK